MEWRGSVRSGKARIICIWAWPGTVGHGKARQGLFISRIRTVSIGEVWRGQEWQGLFIQARTGKAGCGLVWIGMARFICIWAWKGWAWLGTPWKGKA